MDQEVKKRSLSNDDIITDMISEIKIEKTLFQSIDDIVVGNGSKVEIAVDCIDPQLLQRPVDESGLNETNESTQNADGEEEHQVNDNGSTESGQVELVDEVILEDCALTDEDEDEEISPSVSELFNWSQMWEDPVKLNVVQLNDSDKEDNDVEDGVLNSLKDDDSFEMNLDITKSSRRVLSLSSRGDQVFPDSFNISFSSGLNLDSSTDGDGEKTGKDGEFQEEENREELLRELRKSVEMFGHLRNQSPIRNPSLKTTIKTPVNSTATTEQPNKNRAIDSFNDEASDEIDIISAVDDSAPSSPGKLLASAVSAIKQRPFISKPPPERGQRFITLGSSVEELTQTRGPETFEATTQKPTTTILPEALPKNEQEIDPKDSQNDQLDKMKSSFALNSNESLALNEDDRLSKANNIHNTLSVGENQLPDDILSYNILSYSAGLSQPPTEVYSGTSLINILANDMGRNLPSTPEQEKLAAYADFKNKDDWIKSLDSAFDIDENLTAELEGMERLVPSLESIEQSTPPHMQLSTHNADETFSDHGRDEEQEENEKIELTKKKAKVDQKLKKSSKKTKNSAENVKSPLSGYQKKRSQKNVKSPNPILLPNEVPSLKSAASYTTINNERIASFFNRLSSRINSTSNPAFKSSSRVNSGIMNEDSANTDTNCEVQSDEQMSNAEVSTPGTVTAKLFEENGIEARYPPKPEQAHFVETILSAKQNVDKSINEAIPEEPAEILHNNDSNKDDRGSKQVSNSKTDPSYWKPNNRFMDHGSKNVHRKVTIKKIFTSKSKDSSATKSSPELKDNQVSNSSISEETTSKLSWKRSIFRKTASLRRKPVSRGLSMESGVSLDGFAAEYATKQGLELLGPVGVLSTEARDARKIIETMEPPDNQRNDGFIEISNGVPVTRDTMFTASDDTLNSFLSEKLASPKSLTEYVPTPMPRERSLSLFYKRKQLQISFQKRNKSLDNVEHIKTQTIRFASSPQIMFNDKTASTLESQQTQDTLTESNVNRSKILATSTAGTQKSSLQEQRDQVYQKPTGTRAFFKRLKTIYRK